MRLPELAVGNAQFTGVAFLALIILGIGAIVSMPASEDPPLELAEANIYAIAPGTSPADVERLIVEPLETALNEIEHVRHLYVDIEDGLARLNIIFQPFVDGDEKYGEVREKVSAVRGEMPPTLTELEVSRWTTSNVNILQLALVGDGYSYGELGDEARRIKRRFERLDGVGKVEIHGLPDEIVRVGVDLDRLAAHGLGLEDVAAAIQTTNGNLPAGHVDVGSMRFGVQTSGSYTDLEDIRQTAIRASGDYHLTLGDVARVRLDYEDPTYLTRYNGQRCAFVTVQQTSRADIFWIAETIKSKLPAIERALPAGMRLELGFDQSVSVSRRVHTFASNLIQGVLLVGFLILLVVGARSSLVVMASLPVSFLIGIGLAYLTGLGMHQMTVTGLIVALGLLVDNAIVVVENAAHHQEGGLDRRAAALRGAAEVGWPTLSSTLTTVLAFLPIVLMQDDTGDFIRSMPVTVIYTLLASFVVAMTLMPLLASRLLPRKPTQTRLQTRLRSWIDGVYRPLLSWVLGHRAAALALAALVFAGSLSLFPRVGVTFFPKAEKPQFLVDITLPRGSNLRATDRAAAHVEEVLRAQPEVARVMTNVGRGNPQVYYSSYSTRNKPYYAQVFVVVEPERGRAVAELVADLREAFAPYTAGRVRVREFRQGPAARAPIEVKIHGDNLAVLAGLSADVEAILERLAGTLYVDNPLAMPGTDLVVRPDRQRALRHGLTPRDVDRAVRASLAGLAVSTFRDADGREHDIVLRLSEVGDPSPEDLDRVFLTSRAGALIPLEEVASVAFAASEPEIHHYNLERTASVRADVAPGHSLDGVVAHLEDELAAYPWPANYRYSLGGELEQRGTSFGSMAQAVAIALVSIYGVLVLQFRSFAQPFVIFASIPLAIVGSILALLLTGYSFSFTAFVGLTSLVGIVINDSILLVDFINTRRRQGQDVVAAALEAGCGRFVPVVLTTVTTVGGLLPLTLQGGSLWAPMGWAIIGGLVTSTALTLVVVPALYAALVRGPIELEVPRGNRAR